MSVGSRLNATSTNSPGTSGAAARDRAAVLRVRPAAGDTCDVLIVVEVQVTDGVNGSATSQTERFAAALLAAIRTLMRGMPERCSGAVMVGVEYTEPLRARVDEVARLAGDVVDELLLSPRPDRRPTSARRGVPAGPRPAARPPSRPGSGSPRTASGSWSSTRCSRGAVDDPMPAAVATADVQDDGGRVGDREDRAGACS